MLMLMSMPTGSGMAEKVAVQSGVIRVATTRSHVPARLQPRSLELREIDVAAGALFGVVPYEDWQFSQDQRSTCMLQPIVGTGH